MWQVVTARHKVSGAVRQIEMNVFPQGEIHKYARVWFPESEFTDHEIAPVEKENPKNARANRKRNL